MPATLQQQLDAEIQPLYVGSSESEEDHGGHSTCVPTKWDTTVTVRGVNDAYDRLFL